MAPAVPPRREIRSADMPSPATRLPEMLFPATRLAVSPRRNRPARAPLAMVRLELAARILQLRQIRITLLDPMAPMVATELTPPAMPGTPASMPRAVTPTVHMRTVATPGAAMQLAALATRVAAPSVGRASAAARPATPSVEMRTAEIPIPEQVETLPRPRRIFRISAVREPAGTLPAEIPLVEWLRAALLREEPRKVETPPAGTFTEASEALAVPVTVEPETQAEA